MILILLILQVFSMQEVESSIQQVWRLLSEHTLVGSLGQTNFTLANLSIVVTNKDIIGNVIQEWFSRWMQEQGLEVHGGPHTQSWPDFVFYDHMHLEVKAFDGDAGPNFDVANFDAFIRSVLEHPTRLDTDHIIFEYRLVDEHILIQDIYLKKIWEITGPSDTNILNIQVKQGQPVNIRPKNFRSARVSVFADRQSFVHTLGRAVERFRADIHPDWYNRVVVAYENATGHAL